LANISRAQEKQHIEMNAHLSKTSAIVVLYFPQWDVLQPLLKSLESQVDQTYVISNGMSEQIRVNLQEEFAQSILQELPNNPGLGKALNVGLDLAIVDQCDYAFLFDQDSMIPDGYVINMLVETQKIDSGTKPWIAMGPSFYDVRSSKKRLNQFKKDGRNARKINKENDLISCDCLITSGMLLNLKEIEPFPKFDESFFVDQVDSEWCFRVSALGYRLFGSIKIQLAHRLSDAKSIHIGPLTFLSYSPIRRYGYYKNSTRLIFGAHTPFIWRLRFVVILIVSFIPNLLLDQSVWGSAKAMIKGFSNGVLLTMRTQK
jgi:rhamnosyltransferase